MPFKSCAREQITRPKFVDMRFGVIKRELAQHSHGRPNTVSTNHDLQTKDWTRRKLASHRNSNNRGARRFGCIDEGEENHLSGLNLDIVLCSGYFCYCRARSESFVLSKQQFNHPCPQRFAVVVNASGPTFNESLFSQPLTLPFSRSRSDVRVKQNESQLAFVPLHVTDCRALTSRTAFHFHVK